MNPEDIQQFVKSFGDFMKHADVEIQGYDDRLTIHDYYEAQAARIEVPVDDYIAEFIL